MLGIILDLIFLVYVCIALPVYNRFGPERDEAPEKNVKFQNYFKTVSIATSMLFLLALTWWVNGRSLTDLGLGWPHSLKSQIGLGLAAVLLVSLFVLGRFGKQEWADKDKDKLEDFHGLEQSEHRWKILVLLFAMALTWEIIYRAALVYYFEPYLTLVGACLLAAAIYTWIHGADDLKGWILTFFAALFFTVFYVISDSLWGPILLHGLIPALAVLAVRKMRTDQYRPKNR